MHASVYSLTYGDQTEGGCDNDQELLHLRYVPTNLRCFACFPHNLVCEVVTVLGLSARLGETVPTNEGIPGRPEFVQAFVP